MTDPSRYKVHEHGEMICDRSRSAGYVPALRQAVHPGCTVVDIGSGTGFFALLACRYGASRVYAIESGNAIEVARALARVNDCADRIVFIQDISTRVTLPERVDLIVSDLRGVLPLFERHIPSVVDARRRFLKPSGVMIPRRDTIRVAPVAAPALYEHRCRKPWVENQYGVNLLPVKPLVANAWRHCRVDAGQLFSEPATWAELDYLSIDSPNVSGDLAWTVGRPGTVDGFAVWFDAMLHGEIGFSNAPGQPETFYKRGYFPLLEPVDLATGDLISVALRANLVGDDYTWRWRTRVFPQGDTARAAVDFNQSTFFGECESLASLKQRAAAFQPDLGEEGEAARFMLSLMDGHTSLQEIARQAAARFPGAFEGPRSALTIAGELSQRYARR